MENRSHALATGAFILLLGAALVVVVAWFQGDHSEHLSYTVVSRSGVPGLNLRAPVKLQGVEVGKVAAIAFDPAQPRQILVTIEVEKTAPLGARTMARLGYQGITGLSFIELFEDEEGPVAAGAPARIELRPSLIDQLSTGGPRLLAGVNETALRLNRLLSDGNQQQLATALSNFNEAAAGVAQLTRQLQPSAAALPPLLGRADGLLQGAQASLQRFDGLSADARLLTEELRQRSRALDQLGLAAAQLQTTTQRLELALIGADRPRNQALVDELGQASHSVERAAAGLADLTAQPQGLLFGRSGPPPGPGEAGFDATNRKGP